MTETSDRRESEDKRGWPPNLGRLLALAVFASYCGLLLYCQFVPVNLRHGLLKPVTAVFEYLGLWQNYAVFAPNPSHSNIAFQAQIIFADGSYRVIDSPSLGSMGQLERAVNHRFRKLFTERLSNARYKYLLLPYCRQLQKACGEAEPVSITLYRIDRPISLPSSPALGSEVTVLQHLATGSP